MSIVRVAVRWIAKEMPKAILMNLAYEGFKNLLTAATDHLGRNSEGNGGNNYALQPIGGSVMSRCCILVIVKINDQANRFEINLQKRSGTNVDIVLHICVRFSEKVMVLNTQENGEWGVEERHPLTMEKGKQYKLTIVCEDSGFEFCIDRQYCYFYQHRMPPSSITHYEVTGNMTIVNLPNHAL